MMKKEVYKFLLLSITGLILFAGIMYIVDPLQQYRKAEFFKPFFASDKGRYINPGLAKTYDYNAAIIGSSLVFNFNMQDFKNKLNLNTIKLSGSSLSGFEQKKYLELLKNERKVETIFICIDFDGYNKQVEYTKLGDSFPDYLYDNNLFNDYKYLLNFDIAYKILPRIILANYFGYRIDRLDGKIAYSFVNQAEFSEHKLKKLYNQYVQSKPTKHYNFEVMKNNFNENILDIIKNSKLKIIFFYPPYSKYFKNKLIYDDDMNEIYQFKEYVNKNLKSYQNVKIYDFMNMEEIVNNGNNYSDFIHYNDEVSTILVNEFSRDIYSIKTGHYK